MRAQEILDGMKQGLLSEMKLENIEYVPFHLCD